ncbi:MAG: hypothetical protein IPO32_20510 [Crocinitomicaceae bacterium]|nr:hypothetical protein [Crocinitomicaceae bacterium]
MQLQNSCEEGRVVGRFNGRMEYGPRSLETDPIIASPADPTIRS